MKIIFIESIFDSYDVASRKIRDYSSLSSDLYDDIDTGTIVIRSNLIGVNKQILQILLNNKKNVCGTIRGVPSIAYIPQGCDYDNIFDRIDHENQIIFDGYGLDYIDSFSAMSDFNIKIQKVLREASIENDVYMLDPESVYLSYDTQFGKNVVIQPNVYFGSGVKVGDNVVIKSFSYLEGVKISQNAQIGPMARIRPDSKIGENVQIGNFVEVKNSNISQSSKASHLAYIGDCSMGENVNVGAGVITCNYDGKRKHKTLVGDDVFLGSNSSIIAPITIGNRAIIGASSFINCNIKDDHYASGRSKQVTKPKR